MRSLLTSIVLALCLACTACGNETPTRTPEDGTPGAGPPNDTAPDVTAPADQPGPAVPAGPNQVGSGGGFGG